MMWKPSRYELCERGPYPSPTEVKAPRDWGSFEFDQPPISEFLEFELVMFGPNITGAFNAQANNYNNSNWASVVSGAFVDSKPYPGSQHAYTQVSGNGYGFDASSSNATYSKSTTVQPAALRLLPCIKI